MNYCILRHKTGIFYKGAISYAPGWAIILSFVILGLMLYQIISLLTLIGEPSRVSNQTLGLNEAYSIYKIGEPGD